MDVWLVEDDPRLRDAIASSLQRADSDIVITGVFDCAAAALEALRRGPIPDAALVDLGLPDGCGIRLIADLARPELVLIALTVRFDDDAIFGALRAGAIGYLLKDASAEIIARALRDAVTGGSPMSPSVARRVVGHFQPTIPGQLSVPLTVREREVLELLCLGASYREIARMLGVAQGTVQTHVKHVYEKLGADNKAEAVRIALDSRLVPLRHAG
jgi:DNA-binding NarL/FixJ family response regulator